MSSHSEQSRARKVAAIAALVSVPFAILTQTLFGVAHHGDIQVFLSGEQALNLSDTQASALYYGYWADVLGYYLIFLPVIIYAWRTFREEHGYLCDLAFSSGVIFCVMGAMGAVTQAEGYITARQMFGSGLDGSTAAAIAVWEATIAGHWRGVWMVETLPGLVWFGLMSRMFRQQGQRAFAVFTAVIAIIWGVQLMSWLIPGGQELSDIALALNALTVPLWALWLGVRLLKTK